MIWFMVFQVVSMLVELVRLGRQSESEKDLEILLLRRQLAIYERRQAQAPRLLRSEKLPLVVLGSKLKARTGCTIKAMGEVIRIVKPATLFSWHQQLVRLKWTYRRRNAGGRPRRPRSTLSRRRAPSPPITNGVSRAVRIGLPITAAPGFYSACIWVNPII